MQMGNGDALPAPAQPLASQPRGFGGTLACIRLPGSGTATYMTAQLTAEGVTYAIDSACMG
jgi:hypothetical protein